MAVKEYSDVKLWKHFIKGDDSAYTEVYRRFYPLLYSYGIRLTRNRELVLDTIQNLFVKLILNCRNLSHTDNVSAYLLCAFRHKLFDSLQSLRPTVPIEECDDLFPMDEDVLNALFIKDDNEAKNERRLAKAIASLSSRQREIIYLYYIKELNHQEIAEILSMNTQSSKNLLSRAMTHLRSFFFSGYTVWLFGWFLNPSCSIIPMITRSN